MIYFYFKSTCVCILIIISYYVLRKFIKNGCGVFLLHLFSIFQKKRNGSTYINSLSFELYLFFFLRQGVRPFSFIILLSFWTWKTIFDKSLQSPPFPHHTPTIGRLAVRLTHYTDACKWNLLNN